MAAAHTRHLDERSRQAARAQPAVALAEKQKQHAEIEIGRKRTGQRRTAVRKRAEEKQQKYRIERHVHQQRPRAHARRRPGILHRVVHRRDQLDGRESRQPQRIAKQRPRGERRRFRQELAVLEENLNDRPPQQNQPHGRRNGDERNDPQREAERALHLVPLSRGDLVGHGGQKRGRHGDGVAAQNQLHDAVRHVERRDAARWHARRRRENHVDHHVDLIDAHAEKRRAHQPAHRSHAGIGKRKSGREIHPAANQRRDLHRQLNRAADQDRHRQCNRRRVVRGREPSAAAGR